MNNEQAAQLIEQLHWVTNVTIDCTTELQMLNILIREEGRRSRELEQELARELKWNRAAILLLLAGIAAMVVWAYLQTKGVIL